MPVNQNCCGCGAVYRVSPSQVGLVKYCGTACRTLAQRIQLSCKQCGTVIDTKRSKPQLFCSQTCSHAFAHPSITKACIECGVVFRVPPARVDTAKFCSRECTHKNVHFKHLQSVQQQAEKHWRWAGGKYLERDGYVRQKSCRDGKESYRLAHRILVAEWLLATDPSHPFLNGASLRPEIEVHHIDRDRSHNAFDNLLAVTKEAHARIHHQEAKPEPGECWPNDPVRW